MMFSRRYLPSKALQEHIAYYLILESDEALSYSLLPATTPVMAFDYRGKVFAKEGTAERELKPTGIFGMHSSPKLLRQLPGTGTLIVMFTSIGAASFFQFPLNEIATRSYALDHFQPASRIALLEEQLAAAGCAEARIEIIEQFLLRMMHRKSRDVVMEEAARLIKARRGLIAVRELAGHFFVSESRFEKRFRAAVGIPAKKYASIARLHAVVSRPAAGQRMTDIAYDAGFYDQAHFNREFRQFTGTSPGQYFRPSADQQFLVL